MSREFLEFEIDGENETVHGKTESPPVESKNENEMSSKTNTKRTWTPARELAWAKCQKGREEYIKTKKEITEKEQENIRMKEKIKLEMLKKKIRQEIEEEMKSEMKQNILEDGEVEENQESKEIKGKPKTTKKNIKDSQEESDSIGSSSSEEEISESKKDSGRPRPSKKTKKQKRKLKTKREISDSESSESSSEEEIEPTSKKQRKSIKKLSSNSSSVRPSISRFAFV